jgi:hypothetical protein
MSWPVSVRTSLTASQAGSSSFRGRVASRPLRSILSLLQQFEVPLHVLFEEQSEIDFLYDILSLIPLDTPASCHLGHDLSLWQLTH